jgi:hypothetical protein
MPRPYELLGEDAYSDKLYELSQHDNREDDEDRRSRDEQLEDIAADRAWDDFYAEP